jgi:hypothetical protein
MAVVQVWNEKTPASSGGFPRGAYRNRTGVNGFAGRCVTTPPRRRDRIPMPNPATAPRAVDANRWRFCLFIGRQGGPRECLVELGQVSVRQLRAPLCGLRVDGHLSFWATPVASSRPPRRITNRGANGSAGWCARHSLRASTTPLGRSTSRKEPASVLARPT